jgi:hypothetical protein
LEFRRSVSGAARSPAIARTQATKKKAACSVHTSHRQLKVSSDMQLISRVPTASRTDLRFHRLVAVLAEQLLVLPDAGRRPTVLPPGAARLACFRTDSRVVSLDFSRTFANLVTVAQQTLTLVTLARVTLTLVKIAQVTLTLVTIEKVTLTLVTIEQVTLTLVTRAQVTLTLIKIEQVNSTDNHKGWNTADEILKAERSLSSAPKQTGSAAHQASNSTSNWSPPPGSKAARE